MNESNFKNSRKHMYCDFNRQNWPKDNIETPIKIIQKLFPDKQSTHKTQYLVCYSLWGPRKMYSTGAIANSILIPLIYGKKWTVRVYVGSKVKKSVINTLLKNGAQVFVMNTDIESGSIGAFWRFLPLGEPNTVFVSRDLDSRPTFREYLSVKQWLNSKMSFHRIYDSNSDHFNSVPNVYKHKLCVVPFLAGLFGARSKTKAVVPNIKSMIQKWPYKGGYGGEEVFLAEKILPIAKKYGLYTSIMNGHNVRQANLFLNKNSKKNFGYLMPIPMTINNVKKYQVHAEYYHNNNLAKAKKFIDVYKNNIIMFPPKNLI